MTPAEYVEHVRSECEARINFFDTVGPGIAEEFAAASDFDALVAFHESTLSFVLDDGQVAVTKIPHPVEFEAAMAVSLAEAMLIETGEPVRAVYVEFADLGSGPTLEADVFLCTLGPDDQEDWPAFFDEWAKGPVIELDIDPASMFDEVQNGVAWAYVQAVLIAAVGRALMTVDVGSLPVAVAAHDHIPVRLA